MLISFSFLFVAEDKNYFCNREFSFTLKDDVYLRYKSFANEKELKEEILRLNPYKIDIGAVYTTKVPTHPQHSSLCCMTPFVMLNLYFVCSVSPRTTSL